MFPSNSAYYINTYSPTPKKNYITIHKQFYLLHKYLPPTPKKNHVTVSQNTAIIVLFMKAIMKIETFNSITTPIRPRLVARARTLTGDDDTAEDIVQEVMLRLWNMRDKLENHGNIEALAMTILRNKTIDSWRRKRFEQDKTNAYAEPYTEDNTVEETDQVRLIRAIVDRLPALQSTIFRMKEIEGYESGEIMQITGCTAESLRQSLSRARRKVREEFIRISAMRR